MFIFFHEILIAQKMKQSAGFEPVHLSLYCNSRHILPLDHRRYLNSFKIRHRFKYNNVPLLKIIHLSYLYFINAVDHGLLRTGRT